MPGQQAYFGAVLSSWGSIVTHLRYTSGMFLNGLYELADHILRYNYPHFTEKSRQPGRKFTKSGKEKIK